MHLKPVLMGKRIGCGDGFVGASLLETQGVACREQARSHKSNYIDPAEDGGCNLPLGLQWGFSSCRLTMN